MESPFYILYPVPEPPVPVAMLMGDLSHGEGLMDGVSCFEGSCVPAGAFTLGKMALDDWIVP